MQRLLIQLEGGHRTRHPWLARVENVSRRYLGGRPVSHLTPRYGWDRMRVAMHYRRYPDTPWLTSDAIAILTTALRKSDNGLEWGSGRSTTWFAQRTHSIISVETSQSWHDCVSDRIKKLGLHNVVYKYIPANDRVPDDPYHASYVEGAPELATESLDYVLVDSMYRDGCILRAVNLLKPGGMLILDNAQLYIPHPTRSPAAVTTPPSILWVEFLARVASWRLIWTSNGVWDTAFWFKTTAE